MKRKVIIHKHLFKNAGTTFDWSLKQNFGDDFCDHRDDDPMISEGLPYLIRYLTENPQIKALSSHHIWFRIQNDAEIDLIPVCFLRHPIERIRSVYNFERIQESETQGAINAKFMTFKEYVAWLMQDNAPATIRDFQSRYLAGIKNIRPLTNEQYCLALDELNKYRLVGVVDRYEESMKIFEQRFKNMGMNIDLSFIARNVTQSVENINIEDRVNSILEELGEIGQDVLTKNSFDLELYRYANTLLKE